MVGASRKIFLGLGTGPGIGAATAERFARQGFDTIISARTPSRLAEIADRMRTFGGSSENLPVDATRPDSIRALIQDVVERYGHIDVLHYNVAAIRRASILDQPIDTFAEDLAANITGAMIAVRCAAETMLPRGKGSIFLTGGHFGVNPVPDYLSLSVGKAGLRALALGAFDTFKGNGVQIAVVHVAGPVDPDSELAKGVGDSFWRLYTAPMSDWRAEHAFPS